jgi:CHASE2 domain-containing sensor protein
VRARPIPAGLREGLWRRRKELLLVAVALLAAGLALLARDAQLLRRLEQLSIDARFQIRGPRSSQAAPGIVLVLVDDRTFNYLRNHRRNGQWGFPRHYHAAVIDRLSRAGARVIAYDVAFEDRSNEYDDKALLGAIERAGNVVLSATTVKGRGQTAVLGGNAVVRAVGARVGNAGLIPDSDGVARSTYYSINGLPTFSAVVAAVATDRPVPPSPFGGREHPVPIDYVGPPGSFRSISYSRVLSGRFPARLFTDKTVIVGASATKLQDLHQTPVSGAPVSGPEVQANQVATVLEGIPLRQPPDSTTVLLVVLLALLVPLAGMRLGTIGVVLTAIGVLLAWSVATQVAFDAGSQLDYAYPLAALFLATLGTALIGLWTEGRERKRLRTLFAAGSSPIVEGVLRPAGPHQLEPTAIIAGYRIEEAIGRGGMGVVYRAEQLALERTVALKLIAADRAQDPVFRERFKRESRLAASIEHVNVIPVYEAGEDDGLLFIAMRLVGGADLAELLAREGTLDPARVAPLIAQLAGALDAAHAQGLVHRDVKPANVLLTRERPEHAYLTDFGVAKSIGEGTAVTAAGGWVGTLDYLAPEQIRGEQAGPGVDVYALAGLLCHCLTGQVPFPRDTDASKLWAHVNAPPPSPSHLRPDLPSAIDAVLAGGMAKDPVARFPTAMELAHACARALGVALPADDAASQPDEESSEPRPGEGPPTVVSE